MRPVISIFLMACLIVGCGQDPNAPVYDTVGNPDSFPQVALALIGDLESEKLSDFDHIVSRFSDLYTQESSLLDNQAWKGVIDRLGGKFKIRAMAALDEGLAGYDKAAANFMLASFAHPEDQELGRLGRLFFAWSSRVSTDTLGLFTDLTLANLSSRVSVLRQFELADSLSRAFSREFLRPVILGENGFDGFTADQKDRLSQTDHCLLNYAGLAPFEATEPMATWGEPTINLVAAEIRPTRPGWYLVELYLMADSRIDQDYTIALRAMTEDTLPDIGKKELDFIPFDFSPATQTSSWTPGQVMATAKPIYFDQPLKRVKIGLYLRGKSDSHLKLDQSAEAMYTLKRNPATM